MGAGRLPLLLQQPVQPGGGGRPRVLQAADLPLHGGVLLLNPGQPRPAHQPRPVSVGGQAAVGVVLPVDEAVLRPGGHHAIRLVGALGHQVVDEHPHVPVPPGQYQGWFSLQLQRGVDARHQPLGGGLLVAGGAVELPRPVQAGDLFALQGGQQLRGVHAVVLDGVGAPGHLRPLQAGDGVKHFHLHLLRQGGGEALDIQLLRVQAHRLDKQLVPGLLREPHHLVLDGGAVPRPHPLDHPGKQGGAVEVVPDHLVGVFIGVGEPAHRPVFRDRLRLKGEGGGYVVPRLDLHPGEVHAPAVHPGGRARLEAAQGQPQLQQAVRQGQGRRHAVRPGVPAHLPHDGAAPQVGPGGDHRRLDGVHRPRGGGYPGDGPALRADLRHLRLLHPQVFLELQGVLHHLLVAAAVGLGPEGPDCGALPPVQHPVLDAGLVRRLGHLAAQGVDLPDQVALARAAHGGVAGHIAHRVQVDGEANGFQPHPGGGQGGFYPGVARADHGDVKLSRVIVQGPMPPFSVSPPPAPGG